MSRVNVERWGSGDRNAVLPPQHSLELLVDAVLGAASTKPERVLGHSLGDLIFADARALDAAGPGRIDSAVLDSAVLASDELAVQS